MFCGFRHPPAAASCCVRWLALGPSSAPTCSVWTLISLMRPLVMRPLPWPPSRFAKSSASGDRMEFRHIRSFLSVAETLHFGRSARLLNLSQPALSLQVKALEDESSIQLLSRNRQGTVLTEL